MNKTPGEKATILAANLIQDQLRTLPITIAAIARAFDEGDVATQHLTSHVFQRKLRLVKTGSGGNIVADEVATRESFTFYDEKHIPHEKVECIRVVVSNALVAVEFFLKEHDMASMRTPEFQFLGHVVDAILNANTFNISPGYMPVASFDGLVINSDLNDMQVFGDGTTNGFMEFGDAIALLQWLSRYLSGEKHYVSGGDAG